MTFSRNYASQSRLEWFVFIIALIVQQGAFVSVPMVMNDVSLAGMRDVENPFNTTGVAFSLVAVGILCLFRIRELSILAKHNRLALLFLCLVLLSVTWSIHPGITVRRSIGYVLSLLVAAYLAVRFDIETIMRFFSRSFAISATCSILFALVFPTYGIMQQENDLAGTWQGVFPHKEVLGTVMAVAIFVELYLLVTRKRNRRWHLGLLCMYIALILLSQSRTALLMALGYGIGTILYLCWNRHRLLGLAASTAVLGALTIIFVIFQFDPAAILALLGKDATLTGRTQLWSVVFDVIGQKPLLGWGYRALWQPNDPITLRVDDFVGWGVPSSHNAFLEIALQLGWAGVFVMVLILCTGLWRSVRCFEAGSRPLGWFSSMFFIGAVVAGQTIETLGQNQVIDWVLFNVLFFSCGACLASNKEAKQNKALGQ